MRSGYREHIENCVAHMPLLKSSADTPRLGCTLLVGQTCVPSSVVLSLAETSSIEDFRKMFHERIKALASSCNSPCGFLNLGFKNPPSVTNYQNLQYTNSSILHITNRYFLVILPVCVSAIPLTVYEIFCGKKIN